MNIDSMLRDTLHSFAQTAPPAAGLADAAQARSRHHRRVRRAALAGVGAVAAAAIAAPLLLLDTGISGPGWTDPAGPPPVELAAVRYNLPMFPFTPGWVPDGVPYPAVVWDRDVTIEDGGVERALLDLVHEPGLTVSTWPDDPHAELTTAQEVTVQGRPGRLFTDQWRTIVVWQHADDRWVVVTAWTDLLPTTVSPADLLRYADELVEGPFPAVPLFIVKRLPTGAELTQLDRHTMTFQFDGGDGWLRVAGTSHREPGRSCGPIPGADPTAVPTGHPTAVPTGYPTAEPTYAPTEPPIVPTAGPTSQPDSTPVPPAPPAHPEVRPAGSEQQWNAVDVDGWPEAWLVEHADSSLLCLATGPPAETRVVDLAGSLAGADLVQVAEGLRFNG